MSDEEKIPESTLELLARSIYKESTAYGFKHADYLRLVNYILDATMENGAQETIVKIKSEPSPTPYVIEKSLPLIGEQVKIREYNSETDLPLLEEWVNDKYGRYFLLSCQSTSSPVIGDMLANKSNLIGIITSSENVPVGIIAYLDVNNYQRKAELRKMIGDEKYRGKGLAREATQMWVNYGFSSLKLNKIYLNTLNSNLRNIKLNEDVGFKVEGILRDEVYYDGNYHDVLRMGLVA